MDKIIQTVAAIIVAIVASGAVFVGANKLFDLAPRRWAVFTTGLGGAIGFFSMIILWSNRIVEDILTLSLPAPEVPLLEIIGADIPLIAVGGLVIGGAAGYLLAETKDPIRRLGIGVGGGAALGLLAGLFMRTETLLDSDNEAVLPVLPSFDFAALIIWPLVGVAFGVAVAYAIRATGRKEKSIISTAVFWGSVGWVLGAWLASHLDADGSEVAAVVAMVGTGAGFGAWFGLWRNADRYQRDMIAEKSRIYIFLTPALGFIAATLVVPLLRTLYLSFLRGPPRRPGEFTWFSNYLDVFDDPTIFDISNWSNIFTSRMFWFGIVLLTAGLLIGRTIGKKQGHRMDISPSSMFPASVGVFLLAFAVFASLRGTIFNNLWWVFTVTILATTLGLAIAVLADRARFENVAKSLIFMPMAISFVGAAIIWRFMFIARPPQDDQTGVFNSIWVGLGNLSNSGTPKLIVVIVLLAIVAFLVYLAYKGWASDSIGVAAGSIVTALPLLWIVYRLLGPGLGGFIETNGEVVGDTILFLQEPPFNNVWLMLVLIWIQTGFAMVIFSAAIKAVPGELLEAAKVDGATESQTFWRVVMPSIATTIGVVTTTLIVTVLKVFDIVKVMTNGNFDTQVIANEMWQRAFTELNFGLGSALAIMLFIFVLPIMFLNIRRMQKAKV